MRATRPRFLLAPTLGLLLLAACGGGDPEPTETPEVAEEAMEPSEPSDDDGADLAGSGGAACLEGEWEADVDVLRENAIAAPGLGDFDAEAVVTGTSTTTFDGSTMTTVYANQQTEVSWALEGQQFLTVASYDGTLVGAYTATDNEISIASVDASGLTFGNTTLVNGEEIELPGITEAVEGGLDEGGTSTYTCTADELRIQPIAEGVDTSNLVAVMHRR